MLALLVLVLGAGCTDTPPPGLVDSGDTEDAGGRDAGGVDGGDAGGTDAGDGGGGDAGGTDAGGDGGADGGGTDAGDGGDTDAGGTDAGADGGGDAGGVDGGSDAGEQDGGEDAGLPDGGADAGEPDSGTDAGPVTCTSPWVGDRQEGTATSDETLSVWVDGDGDIYTTGYAGGRVGETNIEPSGNSRAVVARYAADGRLRWRRDIDTAGTDTAEHVTGGRERGTVRVVGRTTGTLEGQTQGGQFDVFLMELDAEGHTLSTLQHGDARPQHPLKVAVDSAGHVVVAGYDDLFVQNRVVLDAENGFVARFTQPPEGPLALDWRVRSQLVDNPDRLTGLALSPAEDAVFTSGFKFFPDDEGPGGAFVRRLDSAEGAPRWTTFLAPVGTEADELLMTPEGGLLLAGSTQLALEPGVPAVGEVDVILALLDPDSGEVRWLRQVGTPRSELALALARAPNGDVYVAGDTLGSFPGFTHQGGRDLFVLRFSAKGVLLGAWQHGTPANDHVTGLAVDACGNALVTGYTEGSLVPGAEHQGSRDAFLLRVAPPGIFEAFPARTSYLP
jgi:hypothetical protein